MHRAVTVDVQEHWQNVYERKAPERQSWYQERPERSLDFLERCATSGETRVLDAGGGSSNLVDHLLERGGYEVTVVDVAPAALDISQNRLGERADRVEWIVADLTEPFELDDPVDVWHDRAVLHFLTDDADREVYLENLERCVDEEGHAIVATFAPDGPDSCSGLNVRRYSPEDISDLFGDDWRLLDSEREVHETPWGGQQSFSYALLELVDSTAPRRRTR